MKIFTGKKLKLVRVLTDNWDRQTPTEMMSQDAESIKGPVPASFSMMSGAIAKDQRS